ncbi:Protein-lysine N-methyltransferase efm4 [Didymella sp. IMI 355093]|nr:Protein-lysine N-methyltransferase efm4 [Didymella sp. IMI 355093]
MTAPFERLPAEVFDIIAACLDLPEYQTIRLSSQRLHLLSLSTFTKKYFTKVITTLGSPSLNRLVHVANHSHLSRLVTTLEIRLLNHRNYKDLGKIARIGIFPPPKRFPKVSCVRNQDIVQESTLYDDVLANRQAKCITERLTRGLRGFPNLTAIRFRAHDIEPLGWKTIAVPEGDEVFRSRCLRAVLDAICQSGITLSTFTMGKEKGSTLSKCANVPYPALQLPLEYLQRLRPSFEGLTHLTISIVAAHNGHHRLPGWENGLSRFVCSAPGLTLLSLSLDRKSQVSQYGARIMRSLSDTMHLERLSCIQVFNTTVHESDLTKFIKTHAGTLQVINLANVCLLTGNWLTLLSAFKGVESLETLRLSSIEGVGSPVQFRQRSKERRKVTLDTARSEQSMATLLDETIAGCNAGESAAAMYALSAVP